MKKQEIYKFHPWMIDDADGIGLPLEHPLESLKTLLKTCEMCSVDC